MKKLLKKLLKYGALAGLILAISTPFLGLIFPWKLGEKELAIYNDQTPVLVGLSYRSTSTFKEITREYVLFPSVLDNYKTINIRQLNNSQPTLNERKNGAFFYPFSLVILTFFVWFFWRKKTSQNF